MEGSERFRVPLQVTGDLTAVFGIGNWQALTRPGARKHADGGEEEEEEEEEEEADEPLDNRQLARLLVIGVLCLAGTGAVAYVLHVVRALRAECSLLAGRSRASDITVSLLLSPPLPRSGASTLGALRVLVGTRTRHTHGAVTETVGARGQHERLPPGTLDRHLGTVQGHAQRLKGYACGSLPHSDVKVANRTSRVWHGATENGLVNDGQRPECRVLRVALGAGYTVV